MNLSTVVTQPGTSGSKQATVSPALIGPNAVIQTLAAVQVLEGAATRDRIAQLAGLPTAEPAALIPETSFLSLIAALRRECDDATSREVLALAGEKTGDYVAANRIPMAVRGLLRVLPARVAIPVLLVAFRRHAWTFAGRSGFVVREPYPCSVLLDDAPTCGLIGAARPTGGYYEAAFQRLLSLASPNVRVTEVECRSVGAPYCRFQIQLSSHRSRG